MQWNTQPELTISEDATYVATLNTNKGAIKIEFFNKDAPITVNNFIFLTEKKFYDNIIFHRIISNFMIQGGCPLGTGTGGPGYSIKDEFSRNVKNKRGTISMANAGPNTGGSQFFINLVDNSHLNGKHTVFGKVIEGMDIVDTIGAVKVGAGDKPLIDVVINDIELIKT
ncbi:MAG: peptidylprolyl isomerase [Methanosarcinales archaeon]|nr:peptidylprolyl isomerase [Methanosarcinales archaeon]